MFNITPPAIRHPQAIIVRPMQAVGHPKTHFAGKKGYDKNDLDAVMLACGDTHPVLLAREVVPRTDNPAVIRYLVEELNKVNYPVSKPLFPQTEATMLHSAIAHGSPAIVAELLALGADPLITDRHDKTAFDWLEKTPEQNRSKIQKQLIHHLSQRVQKAEAQGGWFSSWFGRGTVSVESPDTKAQPLETSEAGIQTESFVSERESNLAMEVKQLKLSSKTTQQHLDKTKNELSAQNAKLKKAQEKAKGLEKQLNPLKNGNSTLQAKVDILASENSHRQEQFDKQTSLFKTENSKLQDKINEQMQQAEELQIRLTALNETLEAEKAKGIQLSDKAAQDWSHKQKDTEKKFMAKTKTILDLKKKNHLLHTQVQKLAAEREETQKTYEAKIQTVTQKVQAFETRLSEEKVAHHQTQKDNDKKQGELEYRFTSELRHYKALQVEGQEKIQDLERRSAKAEKTQAQTHLLHEKQQRHIRFLEQQIAAEAEAHTKTQADSWDRLRRLEAQIEHERGLHASIQADQFARFNALEKQQMDTSFKAAESEQHQSQLNEQVSHQARIIQNMGQSLGSLQESYWEQENALKQSRSNRKILGNVIRQRMEDAANKTVFREKESAAYKELMDDIRKDTEQVDSLEELKETLDFRMKRHQKRVEDIRARENQLNTTRMTDSDLVTTFLKKPGRLNVKKPAEAPF